MTQREARDKDNTVFLKKKKYSITGKIIHYEHPQISHRLTDCAMKKLTHQFHKIFFHISKCLAGNAEKKTLQLKITKNEYS